MADSSGRLGVELLADILSRLPAKPLFRSQCVSRSWRALIREEIYPRRVRTAATSGLFLRCLVVSVRRDEDQFVFLWHAPLPTEMPPAEPDPGPADVTLGFLPRREIREHVVGCCGGLLLSDPGGAELFLCNPATRRWVAVRKPFPCHEYHCFAALAFDPRVSPNFRIAFVGRTYRGELLSVYYAEKGEWAHRAVYRESPEPDSSRRTAIIEPPLYKSGAVALGEALYVPVGSYKGLLARLDLSTGGYTTMRLPEVNRHGRLGQSQGHLHLMVEVGKSPLVEVWMLTVWQPGGDDDGGWVKKYDGIDIRALALEQHGIRLMDRRQHSYGPPGYQFLCFHPSQDTVFILLTSGTGRNKIFACDLEGRALREVCDVGCDGRWVECDGFPFTPSLLGC